MIVYIILCSIFVICLCACIIIFIFLKARTQTNNDVRSSLEPCSPGYTHDSNSMCSLDPTLDPTIETGNNEIPAVCGYDMEKIGLTCWSKCPDGATDKGALCETCPEGMKNNGASICHSSCDDGYTYDGTKMCNFKPTTIGIGIIPNLCPDGYNNFGGVCYNQQCRSGYIYDKQISCIRVNKSLDVGTPMLIKCPDGWTKDGLLCREPISTDSCAYKTPRSCIDSPICCDCGGNKDVGGICWTRETFPKVRGCTRKCQDCVGGDCISRSTGGQVKSGDFSCPSGKNKIGGLCYNQCPDGYKYNDPNLPTFCIPNNDNGPIITQMDTKKIQCNNNLDNVDGLCYNKCPDGLSRVNGAPTQCQGSKGIIYPVNTALPQITNKTSIAVKQ